MGNNKKARSKNRKKDKPKTQHRNVRSFCSSNYFHPEDDLEGLLRHVHAKEVGHQKLFKYIPRTLQKVKEKKTGDVELVRSLVNIYRSSYFPLLNEQAVLARVCHRFAEKALHFAPSNKDLVSEDEVLKFSRYMQFLVSNAVVSDHITKSTSNGDVVDSTKAEETAGKQEECTVDESSKKKDEGGDDDGDELDYLTNPRRYRMPYLFFIGQVTEDFKSALDSTCKAWAKRMDELMRNESQEGDFLSRCPVYARDRGELYEIKRKILEETTSGREGHAVEELLGWASCFSLDHRLGIHDVKRSCWECGKVCLQNCFYECGCCKTATYCGEACQKQAWESGHNKACKGLRTKLYFLEDSIRLIDEKHKELIDSGTGTPPAMCDYAILRTLIDGPIFTDPNASMSNFYSNLERVQKGEWWIIDQTPTIAVYMSQLGRLDGGSSIEITDFLCFAEMMTSSWTALSETSLVEVLRRVIYDSSELRMPAERFLQLHNHHCSCGFPVGGSGWKQTKRFLVKNAFCSLRASCHKINDSTSSAELKDNGN